LLNSRTSLSGRDHRGYRAALFTGGRGGCWRRLRVSFQCASKSAAAEFATLTPPTSSQILDTGKLARDSHTNKCVNITQVHASAGDTIPIMFSGALSEGVVVQIAYLPTASENWKAMAGKGRRRDGVRKGFLISCSSRTAYTRRRTNALSLEAAQLDPDGTNFRLTFFHNGLRPCRFPLSVAIVDYRYRAASDVEDTGAFVPREISESDSAAVGRYPQLVTPAPEICQNAGLLPPQLALGAKDPPVRRNKEHSTAGQSNEIHDRSV
jgi:hypothetical protein